MSALVALLFVCGLPRLAAADISLDTLVGFGQNAVSGSHYSADCWTPVTIYIGGQGMRGNGQLQLEVKQGERSTTYTRRVSLHDGPLNEVVNFTVLLETPNQWAGTTLNMHVQLLIDGRKVAEKRPSLPMGVPDESFNILALTRDGSGLNFLVKKKLGLFHRFYNPAVLLNKAGSPAPDTTEYERASAVATSTVMYGLASALPASAQGYELIDAIALGDMPLDNLTEDQLEALKGYVRNGGSLIISGGSDLSRLKSSFFSDMLPVERLTLRSAGSLDLLARRYQSPLALPSAIGLIAGVLKPGAQQLLGGLITSRSYGNGAVLFTAFDYVDPALRSWKGAPSLWRDLLRCGANRVSPRRVLETNAHNDEGSTQLLTDALAGTKATSTPPLIVVSLFLAAYLILLVPVSYFLLKKMDKRELAWFTSPLLILGFTVLSYVLALSIKGGELTMNRVVVLETVAGSDQVAGYAQTSLYSPRRAEYDLSMAPTNEANSPYRQLIPAEITGGAPILTGALNVDMDTTAILRGAEVRLWDKRSFDTPVAASLGGAVEATTRMVDKENALVTVTNRTRFTLEDCLLLAGGQADRIGALAPGASATKKLKWSYKDFSAGLTLPSSEAGVGAAAPPDSPELTETRLRSGLISALLPQGTDGYDYSRGSSTSYGRSTNALIGWFRDPLLSPQVDGHPVRGVEANLLLVHLPTPANATPSIRAALNPFAQQPTYDIADQAPAAMRSNVNHSGIYR